MSGLKPALTPEEWASREFTDENNHMWDETDVTKSSDGMVALRGRDDYYSPGFTAYLERTHALAALCLHEQPFGFTRKDVRFLDDLSPHELGCALDGDRPCDCDAVTHQRHITDLANRIDALLPPESI